MTTALEGVEESVSRLGRSLPPGKTGYPLYRRVDGPQDRSGHVRKISPPPGFDPRIVQPVASRYTDYATRPTLAWSTWREKHEKSFLTSVSWQRFERGISCIQGLRSTALPACWISDCPYVEETSSNYPTTIFESEKKNYKTNRVCKISKNVFGYFIIQLMHLIYKLYAC